VDHAADLTDQCSHKQVRRTGVSRQSDQQVDRYKRLHLLKPGDGRALARVVVRGAH